MKISDIFLLGAIGLDLGLVILARHLIENLRRQGRENAISDGRGIPGDGK